MSFLRLGTGTFYNLTREIDLELAAVIARLYDMSQHFSWFNQQYIFVSTSLNL